MKGLFQIIKGIITQSDLDFIYTLYRIYISFREGSASVHAVFAR